MRISASKLNNKLILKTIDLFWNRHKWARINIKWHGRYVAESKLATRTPTEAVDLSKICQDHCVNITARSMNQFVLLESIYTSWNGLVWISILISRECLSVWMAELSACSSTPRIQMTTSQNRNCMRLAA